MGWIAITPLAAEQDGGQSANRARQALLNRQGAGELMPRGTLMIEARVAAAGRPVSLMSVDHIHPWHGAFSVNVLPGGSISLLQRQNDTTRHAVLQIPPGEHAELIRLTFVWDAPARCARLWLEWPEEDTLPVRVDMADPMPIPSDALCFAILASEHGTQHIADPLGASRTAPAEEVDFVALSDEIEPIGPLPGLARDVPVMTRPARALCIKSRPAIS